MALPKALPIKGVLALALVLSTPLSLIGGWNSHSEKRLYMLIYAFDPYSNRG